MVQCSHAGNKSAAGADSSGPVADHALHHHLAQYRTSHYTEQRSTANESGFCGFVHAGYGQGASLLYGSTGTDRRGGGFQPDLCDAPPAGRRLPDRLTRWGGRTLPAGAGHPARPHGTGPPRDQPRRPPALRSSGRPRPRRSCGGGAGHGAAEGGIAVRRAGASCPAEPRT